MSYVQFNEKIIKIGCREDTKIMKGMSVVVSCGSFVFFSVGLGDKYEDALQCRLLFLNAQI